MNLPEALRKQKENFRNAVPEETVLIMDRAIKDLSGSDIVKNGLKPGDIAPEFTLEDSSDVKYTLSDYLANGPVILNFFRGDW